MTTLAILLADFNNPHGYDNGQTLKDLMDAQGQGNWLLCIAIGALFFIALSTRFKP